MGHLDYYQQTVELIVFIFIYESLPICPLVNTLNFK